jgi:hypothetical protein
LGVVATRAQVTELIDRGFTYDAAARELGIPAGLAFMLATGAPADGGTDGSQDLVNPPPVNPTRKGHVMEWVQGRAAGELKQG